MNAMLPGLCIFMTRLCFNMASDGLRMAMDVRAQAMRSTHGWILQTESREMNLG
jgi:hypothetical protein